MNFNLSEEYQAFADSVARFAQDKLAPGALERAHSNQYPWETAALLAEQGLLGIVFPEEDGGQGGTLMHAVLAIQQVALACPKSADIVQAGNFGLSAPSSSMPTRNRRPAFSLTCCLGRN